MRRLFYKIDWLDWSAIGMSGLCMVHCLAGGLFIAALSALSMAVPQSHLFHIISLILAVPLTLIALGRGWKQHKQTRPFHLGMAGLMIMIIGILPGVDSETEVAVTIVGVVILAIAHVLNMRAFSVATAGIS